MKVYVALCALLMLAGCAAYDRQATRQGGDFAILDAKPIGTGPYDYKLSFVSKAAFIYDLSTPAGRLTYTRDELGKSCPNPTIVTEQKIHLYDALLASVDQYITEIKCHPVTT